MQLTPTDALPPVEEATDESLVWSLSAFENRMRAVRFIRQFQNILCVYSPRVHQLYAHYEVLVPQRGEDQLIVVPDLFAFHETWYDIRSPAIRRTGLFILPGELVGRQGLQLRIPFDNGKRGRVVPLTNGLRAISRQQPEQQPFLPVILRGDLRALRRKTPLLHLHQLDMSGMRDKSRFEVRDIRETVRERLRPYLTRRN